MLIPLEWLPDAIVEGVNLHWTAGTYTANSTDKKHYHALTEGNGNAVRGVHSIKASERIAGPGTYAAHTLGHNTKRFGLSMCCMAGAQSHPFKAGAYPVTMLQWDAHARNAAIVLRRYKLPVTRRTCLWHSEVQDEFGIKQNGKWDSILVPDRGVVSAREAGNAFRALVSTYMGAPVLTLPERPIPPATEPMRPLGSVNTHTLNLRQQPDATSKLIGKITMGDKVEINRVQMNGDTEWLSVIVMDTRQWAWVAGRYIDRD